MLEVAIPGRDALRLRHLVLDVNGTLAVDGHLQAGVAERLAELQQHLTLHLLTADTHGGQDRIDQALGVTAVRLRHDLPGGVQKADHVRSLGPASVVAVGNGANDALMLRAAALGIAVVEREGAAMAALQAADVVVTSAIDALDLLLFPRRLVATLRA